jgi:hypothetical protein
MVGIFETAVRPVFMPNFNMTQVSSMEEASITSSLILTVRCVEVKHKAVFLKGDVPTELLFSRMNSSVDPSIRQLTINVFHLGKFYTTWKAVLEGSQPIGFLTFYPPFEIIRYGLDLFDDPGEDTQVFHIAIRLDRIGESLPCKEIGRRMCEHCGQLIPYERLKAVPDVTACVSCLKLLEERTHRHAERH